MSPGARRSAARACRRPTCSLMLGAPALVALEDRSAGQLAVLHPETLVATEGGVAPVSSVVPEGRGRPPHYIFEFTAGERIGAGPAAALVANHRPLRPRRAAARSLRSCAPLWRMPATPAPGYFAASTRCRRSAPRRSSTMPPVSPLPGGKPACRSSIWSLAAFRSAALRDLTIARLLPAVTSVGMSLSELADLTGESGPPEQLAIRLAESHGLERVCIHADEWAFAVTRGDAERELEALEMGCLLASARAAHGYFATPKSCRTARNFAPRRCRPASGAVAGRWRAVRPPISKAGRDDRAGRHIPRGHASRARRERRHRARARAQRTKSGRRAAVIHPSCPSPQCSQSLHLPTRSIHVPP